MQANLEGDVRDLQGDVALNRQVSLMLSPEPVTSRAFASRSESVQDQGDDRLDDQESRDVIYGSRVR